MIEKNDKTMTHNILTFLISGQTFALPLEKIVNLIEKPSIKNEFGNDGLPILKVEFNGVLIPIYNISIYIGKKNNTSIKNGFLLIVETAIQKVQTLIGIHIDSLPEVVEIEDYQMFSYPPVSESYPSFIASAIVCHEAEEITMIDIDSMFDKEKMRIKTLQEQFLS